MLLGDKKASPPAGSARPGPAHLVPTSAPTHCPLGQSPSADPELSIGTPPHHSATLGLDASLPFPSHKRSRAASPKPAGKAAAAGGRPGGAARPSGQGERRGGGGSAPHTTLPCRATAPGPHPASPDHNAGAAEPPSSSCPGTAPGQLLPRSTEGGAGRAGPRGEVGGCERSRMLLNGSPFQRE